MRQATIKRNTAETEISLFLELDGTGKADIQTDCGFLNHMLNLFGKHGRFDLNIQCSGDSDVDYHHTAEDIAICLGRAFREALGDMGGITRYGDIILPMDETLILAAVDISGRGGYYDTLKPTTEKVGDFDTELGTEFWKAFCRESGITMHMRQLCGDNSHHILEGSFKAAARALKSAVRLDSALQGAIPSTKGTLL